MLEIWKEVTASNKTFRALLNDLSIAFDCLIYDVLIGKLYAHGIDLASLNLLQDYLTNRKVHGKKYFHG